MSGTLAATVGVPMSLPTPAVSDTIEPACLATATWSAAVAPEADGWRAGPGFAFSREVPDLRAPVGSEIRHLASRRGKAAAQHTDLARQLRFLSVAEHREFRGIGRYTS